MPDAVYSPSQIESNEWPPVASTCRLRIVDSIKLVLRWKFMVFWSKIMLSCFILQQKL